jgi:hypothetical protein
MIEDSDERTSLITGELVLDPGPEGPVFMERYEEEIDGDPLRTTRDENDFRRINERKKEE